MTDVVSHPDGSPVEFYHGSCREISVFGPLRYDGVGGIYLTASLDDAWDYAEASCIEEGDVPTVMVVHLVLKNPATMIGIDSQVLTMDQIGDLKRQGFDGVVGTSDATGEIYEYAVFDPEQVVRVGTLLKDQSPTIAA